MVGFRRTIGPYWPTKCVFRLSAANGESKPRIGQTGQCRISVQNQCILRPFPVPACLQSVLWKRNRAFESNPLRQPVSLFLSLGGVMLEKSICRARLQNRGGHGARDYIMSAQQAKEYVLM